MKKVLSLILVLLLCLGLCACGGEKNDNPAIYVGGWTNGADSFVLMENGKALRGYSSLGDAASEEINFMASYADAGTWSVYGEYLIIYVEDRDSGQDLAQVFKIESDSALSSGGTVYTKWKSSV